MAVGLLLAATAGMRAASAEIAAQKPLTAEGLRAAAKEGSIAFRLSTPEELEGLLGKPQSQREQRQGDMIVQVLEFREVTATFGRFGEFAGPFTLFELMVEGQPVDIGRE